MFLENVLVTLYFDGLDILSTLQ